ncbi:MAG: zinc ribbon domain-containing protein [Anaerolineae bacterium]|nr:zinc ribbon domain-containing protein [Anaerolineae bacterium]
MSIGSLLLVLSVFILVVVYVMQPLSQDDSTVVSSEDHEISALLAERDRTLSALIELDFDHEMGKVPEENYPSQRAGLLQRGAQILQALDQFQAANPGLDLESAAAAAIADPADELESLISAHRTARQGKPSGFCPNCGQGTKVGDRFCIQCGSQLS